MLTNKENVCHEKACKVVTPLDQKKVPYFGDATVSSAFGLAFLDVQITFICK